jgi:formylglycine-generating enzyme required for sulfatase activity
VARLALIPRVLLTALALGLLGPNALGAAEDSVVRIQATVAGKPHFGSGFVVRVDGAAAYVATAAHVVEGDPAPRVFFRSQPYSPVPASSVRLEGGDPDGFAMLRLDSGIPSGIQALAMAGGGGSDLGARTPVEAVGIPVDIGNWAVLPGRVISWKNRKILFSGDVDAGNSGGPLLAGGAVVGMVMRATRFGEAVPAFSLRIFLRNNSVPWGGAAGGGRTTAGRAERPSPPPVTEPPAAPAKLTVRSNVTGDTVFIDGERHGPTRLDLALPAGNHLVRVEKEGYEAFEERVELVAGGEKTLWAKLERAGPKVGETFRDCEGCPEMVVIPAGSFRMGSPEGEPGRDEDEGPVHTVTFERPFAMARHEVTFDQWDACVRDGGCRHKPDDAGWGRGRRPVINVSWKDAKEYVRWLSRKTGQDYRLPSEAEWEYAARAGTESPFFTGSCISTDQANYDGNYDYGGCGAKTGLYRAKTLPVGSLASNPWGLYDVLGNVWEWTEDCWNDSYQGAPSDGSAWTEGDCSRRVLRGGSWNFRPALVRSANRFRDVTGGRDYDAGFRPARTL